MAGGNNYQLLEVDGMEDVGCSDDYTYECDLEGVRDLISDVQGEILLEGRPVGAARAFQDTNECYSTFWMFFSTILMNHPLGLEWTETLYDSSSDMLNHFGFTIDEDAWRRLRLVSTKAERIAVEGQSAPVESSFNDLYRRAIRFREFHHLETFTFDLDADT